MDPGLRTPLLDLFRRGEATRDVRLTAAQAGLAPALEQLALLVLLVDDVDPDVRAAAEVSLAKIPLATLAPFLACDDVPEEIRTFFKGRGISAAGTPLGDREAAALFGPIDPEDAWTQQDEREPEGPAGRPPAVRQPTLLSRIATMSVPDRVKAAMKGSRDVRARLVCDANKMVALAVLSSPKLTETEVESIAKMGSVSEDVLRTIGQARTWTKSYPIVLSLVRNAKTPLAVSMTLLHRLNEADVRQVVTDRNVPEPLRIAARKKVTPASPG